MLVELKEVSPNTWAWTDTNGLQWSIYLNDGVYPVEAKGNSNNLVKQAIKLKQAGFTAREISELKKEGVV